MAQIIPAIMPKSLADLQAKAASVSGLAACVQLDIMDGRYVPEQTWPYNTQRFEDVTAGFLNSPFEVDLMVAEPDDIAVRFAAAGATRVIFHLEGAANIKSSINSIKKAFPEIEVGVALLTTTENAMLEDVAGMVDVVQFMGIEKIGYQGQPFDERVLLKIAAWRAAHPEATISVDGAVSARTVTQLVRAGANRLVSGSYIFESKDMANAVETLKNA